MGAVLMHLHGVSSALWGQHLALGLILTILCAALIVVPPLPVRFGWWTTVGALSFLLLAATLIGSGVEGVRRWIPIGPLQLHGAALALPALLPALGAVLRQGGRRGANWLVPSIGICAMGLLVLQPDASQATAFGVAMVTLLLQRNHQRPSSPVVSAVVLVLAALSWAMPDPLLPVPHVEGIVELSAQHGLPWLVASLVALGMLPLPFLLAARESVGRRPENLSLAAYFGILCVAPVFGAYPVPLLGFGPSPVVGYFFALGWLVSMNRATSIGYA
jgi:cell division protein FtsW (lipid II flippase)